MLSRFTKLCVPARSRGYALTEVCTSAFSILALPVLANNILSTLHSRRNALRFQQLVDVPGTIIFSKVLLLLFCLSAMPRLSFRKQQLVASTKRSSESLAEASGAAEIVTSN